MNLYYISIRNPLIRKIVMSLKIGNKKCFTRIKKFRYDDVFQSNDTECSDEYDYGIFYKYNPYYPCTLIFDEKSTKLYFAPKGVMNIYKKNRKEVNVKQIYSIKDIKTIKKLDGKANIPNFIFYPLLKFLNFKWEPFEMIRMFIVYVFEDLP